MAWIEITEDDVKTRLAGAELSALTGAALAGGQTSPLADVIAQVTREVRGYVAGCAANTLGDGATIPDELLGAALALVREGLASRLPRFPLDETRREQARAARAQLRDAADCRLKVAGPETATAERIASPTPRITARERRFTRGNGEGIL
jgi:hypothetical protein